MWRYGKITHDKHGMPVIVQTTCERNAKKSSEEKAFQAIDIRRTAVQCTASAHKLFPSKLVDIVMAACSEGALPKSKPLPPSARVEVPHDDFSLLVDFE